ncbi:malto-oligosyltrehalose trehalohydrolase [Sphingobacterium griseoflavum]|uniref:Malto-oligosyltrehalose trehalohydrolase n=1 Tax=Sphingobacterium griseoflavum TaxID=1474952 RepID=A0ABQ3HYK7_9SPHI|nr:malto-oligosyltrehalose trehalohydrolase [Sphingobacterium griseoflavum]GHE33100.1 malto-oligosyltrehalose trehalohydrolase [Sphingobacterium griseoflavum]
MYSARKNIGLSLQRTTAQLNVWAPKAKTVECELLKTDRKLPLTLGKYGYWTLDTDLLQDGDTYHLLIDGQALPDPASKSQPEGVHGPSAAVDLHYDWTDHEFVPPARKDLLIYELHVGTFSESHDFQGVIARLPHLLDLGINTIEIMPIAQFPGERNWGYDGVFLFAVQHSYGGAKGLQALVDACHAVGIAVILDVVYNHFGPEGNYLPKFGPYLTDKYSTPWGKAVNFDDAYSYGVRDFVLDNVRMWFEDFHIDGLRMDAVHAIKDFSATHILQEIRQLTNAIDKRTGKVHYLFVECDLNDRRYLEPLDKNGFAMSGQWLDEFHHALRVAVGEAKKGYYAEFNGIADLAKAYESAYVFNGNFSTHRKNFFGSSAEGIDGQRFVVFSQNHDQVGNRMLGERSAVLFPPAVQRLMAFAVLLSPFTPMLFMGEEWGSKTPFQYFVSHGEDTLIEAVRQGRKQEFADFHTDGDPPDPQAVSTFDASVLDWKAIETEAGQQFFQYYRALLVLRKTLLSSYGWNRANLTVEVDEDAETITLLVVDKKAKISCILNFSASANAIKINGGKYTMLFNSDDEKWGGSGKTDEFVQEEIQVAGFSGIVLAHNEL